MSTMTTEFVAVDKNFKTTVEGMIGKKDQLIAKMRQEMRQSKQTGEAHQRHGKQTVGVYQRIGRMLQGSVIGPLVGLAAPGAVLARILASYQEWLALTKELSDATRQLSADASSFLSLQPAGMKRTRELESLKLAAKYGVTDFAKALDVTQAMQSVRGTFAGALEENKAIFLAKSLGVPIATGKELELFGAGQGFSPGQALRMGYVAGKASGRDPAALAKIGKSLSYFPQDKRLGFAVAQALAKGVDPGELATYTKWAGVELGMTGTLAPWYKQHGLAKASKVERIAALAKAGIDTPEEFQQIGLTGKERARKAMADLAKGWFGPQGAAATYGALQERARPGVLMRDFEQMMADSPEKRHALKMDVTQANTQLEQMFGPAGARAQRQREFGARLGQAFTNIDETWGPAGATIGPDKTSSMVDVAQYGASKWGTAPMAGIFPSTANVGLVYGLYKLLREFMDVKNKTSTESIMSDIRDATKGTEKHVAAMAGAMAGAAAGRPLSEPTKD